MLLKPQPLINKRINLIIGLVIFGFTLLIYYLTLARSLSFWDAGEYITCSSILGVPHPPGNPFYILLGRFFAIFGFNIPHAMVINFLSGLLSSFAVMFTYFFSVKFVTMWLKDENEAYLAYMAGFIASIYIAFSFTFWNNAIEAEVYSGLAFTINLIVWLTMIWVEKSDGLSHQNYLLMIIYVFFLGFGIHQTSLQIAPAVLFIAIYPMLKESIKTSSFWKRFAIYLISVIIIYFVFLNIGKATQIPDLPKYLSSLAFVGILYYHLREKVGLEDENNKINSAEILKTKVKEKHKEPGLFSMQGRIGRSTFWERWIIVFIIGNIVAFFGQTYEAFALLSSIILILSGVFITIQLVKRMHDVNKSSWYVLIPVYGLVLTFIKGTKGKNKYGPELKEISIKFWLLALFFIFVGLSTHFFLFIRSAHRPFINEGDPHTIKLFTDYVLRRQYGVVSMFTRRATFLFQMKDQFFTYFSWQFFNSEIISGFMKTPQMFIQFISNIIVTFMGFGGAYYQFKKNKHSFAYFFSFMFMASIAMVFVMNLSDAEVRERDYFYVTAYNFWAFWMALGSIGLIDYFRKKNKAATIVVAVVVLLLPIVNLSSHYFQHDRSREYIALDYGQNILNSVEENAIIFTNGDNDTFPVWYAQAVYDPAAMEYIPPSKDSLPSDVNELIFEVDVNPSEITKKNIQRAMDFKNEQCFGIRKDVTIANLSLLNTPWYIHQLIDHEGVEFNIPDSHIDLCQENPNSVLYPKQVPKDTNLTIKGVQPGDEFTVTFKKGSVLYVKDLAVIQIIKDNYGKRPIYFAVTTPDAIGFEDHLRNEGMVDRLVSTKKKNQFDMERLITNIDSVYSYRAVMDETVYKDHNMRRLLNNYGAAFMRTSQFAHSQKDYFNAIKYMEKAIDFIDNKTRFYAGLSKLYMETGFYLIENERIAEGFEHLENAVYYNRKDTELVHAIFQATAYAEAFDQGISLLSKMKPYQDSVLIQTYIDRIESMK